MTRDDVRRRVQRVRATARYDPEGAHQEEMRLWSDVLHAIAANDGDADLVGLARAAVAVERLDFERWPG